MEKRPRKYKRNRRAAGSGSVRLKNRAWHLQYRSEDGRVKSVRLCEKNDTVYFSATCPAVRELADAKLAELRPNTPDPLKDDIRITDFWENIYLAWAKNTNPKAGEPNLRSSTLTGYQQIWNQHLKPKFGEKTLREYRTSDATQLLTELARTQGRNTLNHIRSVASGIFSHAVATGYLHKNPWSGAFSLSKAAAPKRTRHYSLNEVLSALAALSDLPQCQLVMSLAFFLGLRPGEIRGLRWEDFTSESSDDCAICQSEEWSISVPHVHVSRSIDKGGNATKPKTSDSEGPLPLIAPVAMALSVWRQQCGGPAEGWVFLSKKGTPLDLRDMIRTKIRPTLKAAGVPWKTLYAGRRGAATLLLQLTGNALASQQLLRHRPGSAVTARHYLKAIPEALLRGTKLVEKAVIEAMDAKGDPQ